MATQEATAIDEHVLFRHDVQAEEYLLEHGTDRFHGMWDSGKVNPIELAKALDIRAQMVYNYIKGGKIEGVGQNDTQKVTITNDGALAFAQKYLNRKAVKEAKEQEKIARELRGE